MENEAALILKDIAYRWRPDKELVLNISELEIAHEEKVFIKGASGSGKSTLLSLIGGVILPEQGEIQLLGKTINQLNAAKRDHFRADHIGFIFQLFNLLPYLSVLENVLLPCRFSHLRRANALRRSPSLELEAMRLLEHLDLAQADIIHNPITELSVGQQQRVAAVRALMGHPDFIIADEPTSALDLDRREVFLKLLIQECSTEKITLLFVSHDTTLEHLFDRSIALVDINKTITN